MTGSKQKVLILIILLLSGSFLLTTLVSYHVSRTALRAQITGDALPMTSDNAHSEIKRDLSKPLFISSLMSRDTFLRDWITGGERDPGKIAAYLKEIQDQYGTFTSFFVSEETGLYYHSSGILKTISPEDPRDEWFYRVREMNEEYEINIDVDMANKDALTVFVNYKVYDFQGRFIGATGVGLSVNAMVRMIEEYKQKYNCEIYFIDPAGTVALHSKSFLSDNQSLPETPGYEEVMEKVLSKDRNTQMIRREGSKTHLFSRFIPELDLYLMVEKAEGEYFRDIRTVMIQNLIICLAVTAVVALLAWIALTGYQKQLERMATTDALTGLTNRKGFELIFNHSLGEYRRAPFDLSFILFDLDKFKNINDRYGHLAGDRVLVEVSRQARQAIRDSDRLFRWGGEEFLIILRKCSREDAFFIAEKIRSRIENCEITYKNKSMTVTASLGVTAFQEEDNRDTVLSRVDNAMYTAKTAGRNRTEML